MGATALLAIDVGSALSLLVLTGFAIRHREQPGAVSVGALWLVLGVVAGILAGTRTGIIAGPIAIYGLMIGWMLAVPLWSGFVFAYTGRGPSVTRRTTAIAVVYVVLLGVTTLSGGFFEPPLVQIVRILASVLQTGLIGTGLFGVFVVIRSAVSANDLLRRHAATLAVSGAAVSLLLFVLGSLEGFDPAVLPWEMTALLGVTTLGFTIAVFPFGVFDVTPGTGPLARSSVLESMAEGVVVVDRNERLVDANDAAERDLGIDVARDAGQPITTVLGSDLDVPNAEPTTLSTPQGRRHFEVSQSVLTNRRGDRIGSSYLFQDVTDRETRKQRLEVLDRVLRHNLRNDLDAIRGFAEALDADEQSADELAERIRSTATELVDLGETTERAERIVTRETLTIADIDLDALLESIAEDLRGRYRCRIDRSIPDDSQVRTDRAVLRTALLEVIENAVEHSDNEIPSVAVGVSSTDDGVAIAVKDDGPGIPDRERVVLLDGEEQPLRHGTGVGLWFVSWAVTRLGGDLSIESDDDGSAVVLEIPDRGGYPVES
ncbi:ATP-binding protein [Halorhabdus salina]|uniref:ATP-binding protein n=1 Tax=Halorhabdus salina TaxID=2750670 RepID=UPI0015EEDC0B|nr:ATP-binding protein [Halorhabdus salina]